MRQTLARWAAIDPALPCDLRDALWSTPESLLEQGRALRGEGVRKIALVQWGERVFVLKHYVEPTWRHGLKQLVVRSRARTTWRISHRLADAGILTPRPVACIENRLGPLRLDSYLMYPFVVGQTLGELLRADPQPMQRAVPLVEQCDALWQRLEPLSASLADAHTGNFIITPRGQLWVIDLDKARCYYSALLAARQRRRAWRQLMRSAQRIIAATLEARAPSHYRLAGQGA